MGHWYHTLNTVNLINKNNIDSPQQEDIEDLVKRTDLEEETIVDVRKILSEEFDEN